MRSPGGWVDNAAIAISPGNRSIAFSSHRQARLWEIETGKLLGSWKLPTGIQDNLAFQGNDRLLLARVETTDPDVAPYGRTDTKRYPRIGSIYDLLSKAPLSPIGRIRDAGSGIHTSVLSPDGLMLVLDGSVDSEKPEERSIRAYRTTDSALLWTLPTHPKRGHRTIPEFDATGTVLQASTTTTAGTIGIVLDIASGRLLSEYKDYRSLGPNALSWLASTGFPTNLASTTARAAPLFTFDGARVLLLGAVGALARWKRRGVSQS